MLFFWLILFWGSCTMLLILLASLARSDLALFEYNTTVEGVNFHCFRIPGEIYIFLPPTFLLRFPCPPPVTLPSMFFSTSHLQIQPLDAHRDEQVKLTTVHAIYTMLPAHKGWCGWNVTLAGTMSGKIGWLPLPKAGSSGGMGAPSQTRRSGR